MFHERGICADYAPQSTTITLHVESEPKAMATEISTCRDRIWVRAPTLTEVLPLYKPASRYKSARGQYVHDQLTRVRHAAKVDCLAGVRRPYHAYTADM